MQKGDQLEFNQQGNINTMNKLRQARKLSIFDFMKAFNTMPKSFASSFIKDKWIKQENLPSSSFKAKIDPNTMLWKDM